MRFTKYAGVLAIGIIFYACNESDGETEKEKLPCDNEDNEADGETIDNDGDDDDNEPPETDKEPLYERVEATPCSSESRQPEEEDATCARGWDVDDCTKHEDCKDGENGRCISQPDTGTCMCIYDRCLSDKDCPNGGVCACAGLVGWLKNHRCVYAQCRTSSDCRKGERCQIAESCVRLPECQNLSFYCSKERDECTSNEDCPEDEICTFSEKGHFACSAPYCLCE
ncbi:MAG: hypothetical protein Kow0090_08220 [Myxococcota bacterium]